MKEIKAFIFDLDGVITDTAEYHYLAWKELSNKLEVPFDREFNENLKGVSRMDSLEKILTKGNISGKFKEEEKIIIAEEKNEIYKELIKNITPKDLLPGIENLLKGLKGKDIKIALASASKNAMTVINGLKVYEYFDFIADAAICKNNKPAPDIFLMAAEGLGINPEECIGVEDAEAGIEAINSAKMFSVGVGDTKRMKNANMIFHSTKELNIDTIVKEFNNI
ncbi:MAG: beta-phosphoglucomutase [Clostridiaceae bacterium]